MTNAGRRKSRGQLSVRMSSVIFISCPETLAEKAGKEESMRNFIACGNGFEIRSQALGVRFTESGKFEMNLFKMVQARGRAIDH